MRAEPEEDDAIEPLAVHSIRAARAVRIERPHRSSLGSLLLLDSTNAMAARSRLWSVKISDGEGRGEADEQKTISFGTLAVAASSAERPSRHGAVTYKLVGSRLGGLFDPGLMPMDVLAIIFSLLPTRDKLRVSLVSKAWRAAYRCSGIVWKKCDISETALDLIFSGVPLERRPPFSRTLRGFCARFGRVIEALDVSGSAFTASVDLPRVERALPRLRYLDIRYCRALLEIDGSPNEAASNAIVDALLSLHQRAAPHERFTLLCGNSGLLICSGCGFFCDANKRVARQMFQLFQTWTEKPGPSESFAPRPWLLCDRRLCQSSISDNPDDCACLISTDAYYNYDCFDCSGCQLAFCDGCSAHSCPDCCEMYCSGCFDKNAGACTNDHEDGCCVTCCGEVRTCSVPWCKATMCDACEDEVVGGGTLITRPWERRPWRSAQCKLLCSRCRAFVCGEHTRAEWGTRTGAPLHFRGMFSCDGCDTRLCWQCDPGGNGEVGWPVPWDEHEVLCSACHCLPDYVQEREEYKVECEGEQLPKDVDEGPSWSTDEDQEEEEEERSAERKRQEMSSGSDGDGSSGGY